MAVHGRTMQAQAGPERVWRTWSDAGTWPEWNPGVVSIAIGGPLGGLYGR